MTGRGTRSAPSPEGGVAVGEAPGKLLLLGEHAVVYGAPAIGFPLSRGVRAVLRPGRGRVEARLGAGLEPPGPSASAAPDDLVARALGDLAAELDVALELDVPPMCGYGSSAAVAVALLRARAAWLGRRAPGRRALWADALRVEEAAHARPSGVDPAVVVWGTPIVFVRGRGEPRVRKQTLARPLWVLAGWCGSHGGTRVSVTGLATLKQRRPRLVTSAMATLGEASTTGSRALRAGDVEALGACLDLAHGVLAGLGLVGDAVESAVRAARAAGALGAKMSGAGGAGGAWIAVFDDPARLREAEAALAAEGRPLLTERLV